MPNLLFLSDNQSFAEDLSGQIKLYAPDFNIFYEDNGQNFYDLILLDEKVETAKKYAGHPAPVFLLLPGSNETAVSDVELIAKPLSLSKLLDRLKSGIHLFENSEDGYLQFNDYELRPLGKEIYNFRNDEVIKLTEKEIAILKYLYKAGADKIVSKNELLQEVWGYNPDVTTHTIETHIYRLRQKVEHDAASAQLILTTDGGYQLKF